MKLECEGRTLYGYGEKGKTAIRHFQTPEFCQAEKARLEGAVPIVETPKSAKKSKAKKLAGKKPNKKKK